MSRIVGYARESTREQAVYGFNLDEQERWIKEYVDLYYPSAENHFSMIREEGASAKSLLRPRFAEIMDLIKNEQVDILIVHNLDRLTRQLPDLHKLLDLFQQHHVQLISLKENVDTETVQGKFFVSVIILIAQWEEETIGERCVRGRRESARQGNYAKATIPFGYYRDPNDRTKLLIDEKKAEVVRRIFNSIADGSHSYFTMANELRDEGVCDRKWVQYRIERIIKNKIYYGTFSWYGEDLDGHQPAIIDKELWDRANNMSGRAQLRSFKYMFKGMVQCSRCRCVCEQVSTTKSNGKTYLYYRCPECRSYYNENRILSILEDDLNAVVWNHHMFHEAKTLSKRLSIAKQRMHGLMDDHAYYRFNNDYVNEMLGLYAEERDSTEKELDAVLGHINKMTFRNLDESERKMLLEQYIDHIEVEFKGFDVKLIYTDEYEKVVAYARKA